MAKYTDEQIKKALECCGISGRQYCDSLCPLFYNGAGSISACRQELHISALHLINRQEAEKAELQREIASYKSEIERLKKDNEYILMQHKFQRRPDGNCWNDVIEKAKSEAIKEFAERLKAKIYVAKFESGRKKFSVTTIDPNDINNLVKEMVGESK